MTNSCVSGLDCTSTNVTTSMSQTLETVTTQGQLCTHNAVMTFRICGPYNDFVLASSILTSSPTLQLLAAACLAGLFSEIA